MVNKETYYGVNVLSDFKEEISMLYDLGVEYYEIEYLIYLKLKEEILLEN